MTITSVVFCSAKSLPNTTGLSFLWGGITTELYAILKFALHSHCFTFTCYEIDYHACILEVGPAWPKGTYGLPRPSLGCPLSNAPEWKTGWRFQDTEDTNPNNYKSDSFHMDAVVDKSAINKTFCIATKTQKKAPAWPKGEYWTSLVTSFGWKGLTEAGRTERDLVKSELVEGKWVLFLCPFLTRGRLITD